MISPTSSDLSLFCAQLYHHLRIWSYVIPLYPSMPYSWVNTEYSIHQVQHHPKIDSHPLPASFSSLGGWCTQLSTFPQLQVNQWIESQLPSRLHPNRPPPATPPISLDDSLLAHLQTRSITTSKFIFWVHWISASKCISRLAQLRLACSHNHGFQVHISNLGRSWPPSVSPTRSITASTSASPNSLDTNLGAHL